MPRHGAEDREFKKQFDQSLSIGSYYDQILDKLYTGKDIQPGTVPNFADPDMRAASNESGTLYHLDEDAMFKVAAQSLGGQTSVLLKQANVIAPPDVPQVPRVAQGPQLTKNQYNALQKYPALIEFLGTEKGAAVVKEIAAKVNVHVVEKVGENTKKISKYAQVCVADRQNIKQYFAGEDNEWICVVTASGSFRGDEAFFYKPEEDRAYVLREVGDYYANVTKEFNVVHEFAVQEGA